MKAYPECFACIFDQAIRVLRKSKFGNDDEKIWNSLLKVTNSVKDIPYGLTPAQLAEHFYPLLSEITGISDPYKEEKEYSNDLMLNIYDDLKNYILDSASPIVLAIKASIAGNMIDFGVPEFDPSGIESKIIQVIKEGKFGIDDSKEFLDMLNDSKKLLFIHDNCGEVVMDKLLIEIIKLFFSHIEVISVVRDGPIINDVTLNEARQIHLDDLASLITTNAKLPGLVPELMSEQLENEWEEADIIISKGQGNFEGIEDIADKRVFFLLRAKCDVIAKYLNVEKGDLVIKRGFKIN
ncbi:MAG TPA: DUF89 family protein [Thermotogaceae bacterium]|nr:DUF89 family protein [Thermotogaceae bacterium]